MAKYKITFLVGDKRFDKEFIKINDNQDGYKKIGSGFGLSFGHVAHIASKYEDDFISRAIAYSAVEVEHTPLDDKPGIEYTFYEKG